MDQRPKALISAKAKKFIRPFTEKPKTDKNVQVAKGEKVNLGLTFQFKVATQNATYILHTLEVVLHIVTIN